MRDTYINSIIQDGFLKHKIYIGSYAVKTVENSFTWCGHDIYIYIFANKMKMQNEIFL